MELLAEQYDDNGKVFAPDDVRVASAFLSNQIVEVPTKRRGRSGLKKRRGDRSQVISDEDEVEVVAVAAPNRARRNVHRPNTYADADDDDDDDYLGDLLRPADDHNDNDTLRLADKVDADEVDDISDL